MTEWMLSAFETPCMNQVLPFFTAVLGRLVTLSETQCPHLETEEPSTCPQQQSYEN